MAEEVKMIEKEEKVKPEQNTMQNQKSTEAARANVEVASSTIFKSADAPSPLRSMESSTRGLINTNYSCKSGSETSG